MSYTPPGQIPLYEKELVFQRLEPIITPIAITFSSAIELAKWQIIKPAVAVDNSVYLDILTQSAEIKRTVGAGTIRFGIDVSDDDVSWTIALVVFGNNAAFTGEMSTTIEQTTPKTTRFLRVSAYNSNATTEGELQRMVGLIKVILPFRWSISRVL